MEKLVQQPLIFQRIFSVAVICLGLCVQSVWAMPELIDSALAEVSGEGIVFGLKDFSFRMAPTSYVELTGTTPNAAATAAGWRRGDARYYGLSFTGFDVGAGGAGMDWYGSSASAGCTQGANGLGCPMGAADIKDFASAYNPFILRVFQRPGYNHQGMLLTGVTAPTVLEIEGPTKSDKWRWSFWGELEVGRGTTYATSTTAGNCLAAGNGNTVFCGLQSQVIVAGKPITKSGTPSLLRMMRTKDVNPLLETVGFTYQSALSGDFRMSVAQVGSANTGALHQVPDFNDAEGLFFKNVDAFLPLGRLNYQAITLNSTASKDGNFVVDLTQIPNTPNLYNDFYCAGTCTLDGNGFVTNPNPATHGYVRWGDLSGANVDMTQAGTSISQGIYFSTPAGAITNVGTVNIEGLLIHGLKITTKGI